MHDILPDSARRHPEPYKLSAQVEFHGQQRQISVIPDLAVHLTFGTQLHRGLFLEIDRGTEPIQRRSLQQTSVYGKCLIYAAAHKQEVVTERLDHVRSATSHDDIAIDTTLTDWRKPRVAIITTSPARARAIIDTVNGNDPHVFNPINGSPLFMVTDLASLVAAPDLLAHRWLVATVDKTATLERKPAAGRSR